MGASYYTSYLGIVYGSIGVWALICSIIVVVSATQLNSNPIEHTKWGVIILVFSIIGIASLFGIIGGILALVFKSEKEVLVQQAVGKPINRICPQCGWVIDETVKFCTHCGKQLL
jgi:hypothetical protein